MKNFDKKSQSVRILTLYNRFKIRITTLQTTYKNGLHHGQKILFQK